MRPVVCGQCGTEVLCEKFSPAHTQVQWTDEAAAVCPRIAARVAAGEPSARVRSCAPLRASIEAAVREGRLEVPVDA
uniref:Ferredoxin n=1 Tax=Streptomyces sp. NBC_00049 TaxID=2903617 RepID=A0AAU2JMW4_9ACTN